jgi:hypothetical protein
MSTKKGKKKGKKEGSAASTTPSFRDCAICGAPKDLFPASRSTWPAAVAGRRTTVALSVKRSTGNNDYGDAVAAEVPASKSSRRPHRRLCRAPTCTTASVWRGIQYKKIMNK